MLIHLFQWCSIYCCSPRAVVFLIWFARLLDHSLLFLNLLSGCSFGACCVSSSSVAYYLRWIYAWRLVTVFESFAWLFFWCLLCLVVECCILLTVNLRHCWRSAAAEVAALLRWTVATLLSCTLRALARALSTPHVNERKEYKNE